MTTYHELTNNLLTPYLANNKVWTPRVAMICKVFKAFPTGSFERDHIGNMIIAIDQLTVPNRKTFDDEVLRELTRMVRAKVLRRNKGRYEVNY